MNTNANATMTVDQVQAASAALKKLRSTMFQNILTPEERSEYVPLRVTRGLRTLETRLNAAMQHQELLPASLDLRQFERDAHLARALKECLTLVKETEQAVSDTLLVVGSHAVLTATVTYKHLKLASEAGQGAKRPPSARRSQRTRSRVSAQDSSTPTVATEAPAQAELSKPAPAAAPTPEAAPPSIPGNVVDAPSSVIPTRTAA